MKIGKPNKKKKYRNWSRVAGWPMRGKNRAQRQRVAGGFVALIGRF